MRDLQDQYLFAHFTACFDIAFFLRVQMKSKQYIYKVKVSQLDFCVSNKGCAKYCYSSLYL